MKDLEDLTVYRLAIHVGRLIEYADQALIAHAVYTYLVRYEYPHSFSGSLGIELIDRFAAIGGSCQS